MAIAGVFASSAAGLAQPQSYKVSLAAIEAESPRADLNVEAPADAGSPAAELPSTGNPLWAIPISKLSATRDRPLFSVSRHPRTPTVAAAPVRPSAAIPQPVALETPPFTLVGTIIGDNGRIAILSDESSKMAIGVKEGEQTSGWTLRSVESRSAVLEGTGRSVRLDLPEPDAQAAPAPHVADAPRKRRSKPDNPDNP
jgi:general secretion pathway protein N